MYYPGNKNHYLCIQIKLSILFCSVTNLHVTSCNTISLPLMPVSAIPQLSIYVSLNLFPSLFPYNNFYLSV